jgi:hypothetical protein
MASNKLTFCAKIKQALDIKIFSKTISRYLNCPEKLKFCKIMSKSPENKVKVLNFAKKHFKWSEEWKNVIFSNKKSLILMGQMTFIIIGRILKRKNLFFFKCVQGGGSVMIWGAFSSKGKSQLKFFDDTLTDLKYTSLLRTHLLPYKNFFHQDQYIFQHDNAPCHRAKTTIEWLVKKELIFLTGQPIVQI